jgi:hypothetical protein
MAVGAKPKFIKSLQFIEQLRRNVHVAPHADGLLNGHHSQPTNLFFHIV